MSSNQDESTFCDVDLERDSTAHGDQASHDPESSPVVQKPGSPLTPRMNQCGEILATPSGEVTFKVPRQIQSNPFYKTMEETSNSKMFDGQDHCTASRYNVQGQYIGGMETMIGRGVVINGVHGNNIGTQTSGQPSVGLMTQVAGRPHPESPLCFERSRPQGFIGEQVLGGTSGAHVLYSRQPAHAQQRGGGNRNSQVMYRGESQGCTSDYYDCMNEQPQNHVANHPRFYYNKEQPQREYVQNNAQVNDNTVHPRTNNPYMYPNYEESSNLFQKRNLKPATFDGTSSLDVYLRQYNLVAKMNGWSDIDKAMNLIINLRGKAQNIINEIDENDQMNFNRIVDVLKETFEPSNQTNLYKAKLRARKQKRNETIEELAADIKLLTRKAFPGSTSATVEQESIVHFIQALDDSELKFYVQQSRPENMNKAITVTLESQFIC